MDYAEILQIQGSILKRATLLSRGKDRLAGALLVEPHQVDRWMEGAEALPPDVFPVLLALLRAMEVRG
jgi:hypothetical protein